MSEASPTPVVGVRVDRDGIHFSPGTTLPGSLDVQVEGHRVCSVAPQRAAPGGDGHRSVPWPSGLLGFLEGSAQVVIVEHTSGRVVHAAHIAFTTARRRVAVVDDEGHPIAFDKWGQPGRAFESEDPGAGARLATMVAALIADVSASTGTPAFAAYGTLLGAVRAGRLIGHDFDADVAVLGSSWHPADVALDSFRLQRQLAARGWQTHRPCDSMYQVRASVSAEKGLPYIDVFPAYLREGVFEIPPLCHGPLEQDQVEPVGHVTLEGIDLPSPADPEAVLALTYGPSWRTPDPAFRFEMDREYQRRMHGWMGNHLARPGRWRRWHRENESADAEPSDFAVWVADRLRPGTTVLDVCCGTGADTTFLAEHTGSAVGLDFATEAVVAASRAGDATFHDVTVYDLRALLARTLTTAQRPGPKALYCRLGLDALGDSGRSNLLLACRTLLLGGGRSYFEVRARRGNPFRRNRRAPWNAVVDLDALLLDLHDRGGVVVEQETVPGPEPVWGAPTDLVRLVAQW